MSKSKLLLMMAILAIALVLMMFLAGKANSGHEAIKAKEKLSEKVETIDMSAKNLELRNKELQEQINKIQYELDSLAANAESEGKNGGN